MATKSTKSAKILNTEFTEGVLSGSSVISVLNWFGPLVAVPAPNNL